MPFFTSTVTVEFPSERRETHIILNEARNRTQASKLAKEHVRAGMANRVYRLVGCRSTPSYPDECSCQAEIVPYVGMKFQGSDNRSWTIQSMFIGSDGRRRTVIEAPGPEFRTVVDSELRRRMQPPETVEYWTVYPNGNVYSQSRPLQNSSYDLDDLVRLRVVKLNGKIVRKEFL